ncbi:serine esterase, putative [Plasmodium ovale curtisi]|uniref:Serine esterase, putative n=1 Tax=Plasmodium ovale curtisi TaxID=864141 RepID=A0A1A8WHU6_PLAOA|nr:serine esterase, putative [Plasmodium ovale curtisi]
MKDKNSNYRSESIFSSNRNLFEMLEAIDDEKEAKRSANFFNNNKNILLNLFTYSSNNNNVDDILLEKKNFMNHASSSKRKECKSKSKETKVEESCSTFKKDKNCEKKKWIKCFCWFCSLNLLDEILEKEIYKEKIHEHVYDLIYDENSYFDTSSVMSVPYEFARFMLKQLDNNLLHDIKINNTIKEEKYLFKKFCKKYKYNKKYSKVRDVSSSSYSSSSVSAKSDHTLNYHSRNVNIRYSNYLNIRRELFNSDNEQKGDRESDINRKKTFYDSNNLGNCDSSDLFYYKKGASSDDMSNNNNSCETVSVEDEEKKKKKEEFLSKISNMEYILKCRRIDNNSSQISNSSNCRNVPKGNIPYLYKKMSEPVLPSQSVRSRIEEEEVEVEEEEEEEEEEEKKNHYGEGIKRQKSNRKKYNIYDDTYENLHCYDYSASSFSKRNKKERIFTGCKDSRCIFKGISKNCEHRYVPYKCLSRRSYSISAYMRERCNSKDSMIKGEQKDVPNGHMAQNMSNNKIFCENGKGENDTNEKKDDSNMYNKRIYHKYKNNLNYIKKFYYIDEKQKKPFPLCLYNIIKSFGTIKQCSRCYCFFNSISCHCIECKKKYHLKLTNPHYFIFQHGLTASVHDFQNIVNPLLTKYPHLFIYITYSNQSHTFEGVDVGTERICTELNCLFKIINDKINVSMIGHSLGGILNRSVLINLYRKKLFKNKKLINFITFACPHIGVHENMAIMNVLSTYLGAHTIDDLNNKTTLLLKIASVESINILKKFENIIFYGNTQSDWLVGMRTSLILPYTLFNEDLIMFIIEQARNVPEIPINIFSVVHLYMRKKKLLFFYFYQDLKNPNYLLNKRKEQSKFLDQMLQTIISSSKLLSCSKKKKFNIFMNYYSNYDNKRDFEKKTTHRNTASSNSTAKYRNVANRNGINHHPIYDTINGNNHLFLGTNGNNNNSDNNNSNNNNSNNNNSNNNNSNNNNSNNNNSNNNNSNNNNSNNSNSNNNNSNSINSNNNNNLTWSEFKKNNILNRKEGNFFSDDPNMHMQAMPFNFRRNNMNMKNINKKIRKNNCNSCDNISSTINKVDGREIREEEKILPTLNPSTLNPSTPNLSTPNPSTLNQPTFKSHTFEDVYPENAKSEVHSDFTGTNTNSACTNKFGKMNYYDKCLNIQDNYKIVSCSNVTENMDPCSNEKIHNFESGYLDESSREGGDGETKKSAWEKEQQERKENASGGEGGDANCDASKRARSNQVNVQKNQHVINGCAADGGKSSGNNDGGMKKNLTDYKYFEKLFFQCLKTKIINDIKTLDNNLKKKKKKKKNEPSKLLFFQNTFNVIKNYGFLSYSKNNNLKKEPNFVEPSGNSANGENDEKKQSGGCIHNGIGNNASTTNNSSSPRSSNRGEERENHTCEDKKKDDDSYENEKRVDEHDNSNGSNSLQLCDRKNEDYDYISEFFYTSSDDSCDTDYSAKLGYKEYMSLNKEKRNNKEEEKYEHCKNNMYYNNMARKKMKRNNLLKGITKNDKKKYKQILFHIYSISNEQLIGRFFKNPELLYYEVLFYCLNQLPVQRYCISLPLYSNAHVQIIAHPRICSEESTIIKHFVEHLIL